MVYSVSLDVFEGPLDLLLHLIRRAKIDIYDIPIAEITDQYMQYLASAPEFSLEQASKFLDLAATLMRIKIRLLLPKPLASEDDAEQEDDPRAELVRALLEYSAYKQAAQTLEEREACMGLSYARSTGKAREIVYTGSVGATLEDLADAFGSFWREALPEPIAEVRLEKHSFRAAYKQILRSLGRSKLGQIRFSSLLPPKALRSEIVVLFLAILELSHRRRILIAQADGGSEIRILDARRGLTLESV